MDSLTQITLGAAVGELVLGRKLGNRAMLWGAIGGTIPDLDIIANFFMDNVDALAVHRGISHSIFFSVLAPLPFAWLIHQLYEQDTYKKKGLKWFTFILATALCLFVGGGLSYLGFNDRSIGGIATGIIIAGITFYIIYRTYRYYLQSSSILPKVPFMSFYWLFMLAFATHWMLDCFTAYGTQIFLPFSDYRVAFNNISVADPLYTVPFLTPIIIAAFYHRTSKVRRQFVLLGVILSSAYMVFTIFNKLSVDQFFKKALELENIESIRYRTSPSILNNLVWGCVAETDDAYYIGLHSIFDKGKRIPVLNKVSKNHELIRHLKDNDQVDILKWFTDEYYTIYKLEGTNYVLADLRYGAIKDNISSYNDFVFKFFITDKDGKVTIKEDRTRPDNPGKLFKELWERIKGR